MAAATAGLDILGTQMPLHYDFHVTATVSQVKQTIYLRHGLPIFRQTLRLLPAGRILHDDDTLASYGIAEGMNVQLLLHVSRGQGSDVPIHVDLRSPQFPKWQATVRCRETSTLAEFKNLAAEELRWAGPEGMELHRGPHVGRLDREENLGRPIWEYLIMDRTVVWVKFTFNVPQNGTRAP
ncbi:unnamed protein product [Linum trigynum]|uniref:Ubiquitin-like domain-containing protein n=1 Tax=Linum trigynum TaxID=586398 RepID=A0AAV2EUH3_9ROSI